MSTIEELQRRITTAMDRVAQGLDQIGSAPSGPDPETLQALEDERTANAQLTERVRTLKAKLDEETGRLRRSLEEAEARLETFDLELQRMRTSNAQLTEACSALADANRDGVGDPHLINKAMMAELEGLRAARASEIAENSVILSALTPLLDQAERSGAATSEDG